ncbi:Hypothetical protein SMAX5B_007249 [Scophthalmus maximus]|nr:Hypothetical protein SMAX5B_007249 [Scophthalmus maximus]
MVHAPLHAIAKWLGKKLRSFTLTQREKDIGTKERDHGGIVESEQVHHRSTDVFSIPLDLNPDITFSPPSDRGGRCERVACMRGPTIYSSAIASPECESDR